MRLPGLVQQKIANRFLAVETSFVLAPGFSLFPGLNDRSISTHRPQKSAQTLPYPPGIPPPASNPKSCKRISAHDLATRRLIPPAPNRPPYADRASGGLLGAGGIKRRVARSC